MSFFDELFRNCGGNINDMNPLSDEYAKAKNIEKTFTAGVESLMTGAQFKNPKIEVLMTLFWDLVGNKVVANGWANVETMSFVSDAKEAIVLIPREWDKMLIEDPYMQICALVHNASQAQDFYNKKLHPKFTRLRGFAYEIEIMKTIKETVSNNSAFRQFKPNDYQNTLLNDFPGVPPEAVYVSKPFVMPDVKPIVPKYSLN